MKILILHGLNNTKESFEKLGKAFEDKGHQVIYLKLIGHSKLKEKKLNLKDQLENFEKQLSSIDINEELTFIGFSQGALAFQIFLNQTKLKLNVKKQILLSPALKVYNHDKLELMVKTLPDSFVFPTRTPKSIKMYSFLYVSYYKILLEELMLFENIDDSIINQIPTLIIVDKKDELVNVDEISLMIKYKKLSNWKMLILDRKVKTRVFGKYHAIFHPDFFHKKEWENMVLEIVNF